MKNKTIALLSALVLCISAFVLPTTVFAASSDDTTPPTLTAKLDGETLNIEASDDISGVEAVYVDDTRVNLLVNGKASIALKDYAGDEKQVIVYAVDYSGNHSKEVKLNNPYYKESTQTTANSATPSASASANPSPSTSSTPKPSSTSQPDSNDDESSTSAPSSTPNENEETETAIPEGAFTPDGTGTILDSATEQEDEKQFYTITTDAGNVFYLVIDGKRDSQNVYFLNGVTEADLMALAETEGDTDGAVPEVITCTCTEKCEAGAVNTACPVCKNDLAGCLGKVVEQPNEEPEQPEQAEEKGGNTGMIIFLVIALVGAGGVGYYFKIVRPKQQAAMEDADEFEDDSYGEGFEGDYGYEESLSDDMDDHEQNSKQ